MMAQARRTRADMLAITRAKLISAGRATFGEIGYADASMDEITAAVGLTRGALYHQFDGKKGLLEAVVEQIEDEFHEALVKIRQTVENPWKAFLAGCHVFLDLATQPEYQRIMLRDAPSVLGPPDPATHRCTRSLHAQVEMLMRERIIGWRDPEAMVAIINGALSFSALSIAHADDPQAQFAKAVSALDYALNGLLLERVDVFG